MKKLMAANWKMYKTGAEAVDTVKEMAGILNGLIAFDIGIDDLIQIVFVIFDLFQITVTVIAGKTDRNHKCRMA